MHKLQHACILKLTSRPVRETCSGIHACVSYGLRPMHDTQQCLDCWGHILLKCSMWSRRNQSRIAEHGNPKPIRKSDLLQRSKVEAGNWVADRGAERDLASKQTGAIQTVRRIIMFAGILNALILLFGIDGRGLRVQTSQKSNEWAWENGAVLSLHKVFACQRNPPRNFHPLHCLIINACGFPGVSRPCLGSSGLTRPVT